MAGVFGGRRLVTPAGRLVRPTPDRVREAWFSILGSVITNATVLDLFAGSGALGLEALSRGASHATFVESADRSLQAIRANIASLGVEERCTVIRGDALRCVTEATEPWDLVVADPPYATDHAGQLAALFLRAPFARLLSIEHRADCSFEGGETRRYGDTALTFWQAS